MKEFNKELYDAIETGRKVSVYAAPAIDLIKAFIESGYAMAEVEPSDFGMKEFDDQKEKNKIVNQLRAKIALPDFAGSHLVVKCKAGRVFIGKRDVFETDKRDVFETDIWRR